LVAAVAEETILEELAVLVPGFKIRKRVIL